MSQPNPKLSSLFRLEYPQSVGIFNTYDEAQHVVDHLADARFPVQNLCIVGTELKSVERVLGRLSWGTVIGAGVQSGLSTGLMITLVLWLLMPNTNFIVLLLYALGIGIGIGILMAALGYWMSQGKRDFRSVSQTVATKYELLAEHKVAGQARELIAAMPGARAAQFNPAQFNPAQGNPAQFNPGQPGQPGQPQGGPVPGFPPAPGGWGGPPPGAYGPPPGGQPQPGYQPGYPQPQYPPMGYPGYGQFPPDAVPTGLGYPEHGSPQAQQPPQPADTPDQARQEPPSAGTPEAPEDQRPRPERPE